MYMNLFDAALVIAHGCELLLLAQSAVAQILPCETNGSALNASSDLLGSPHLEPFRLLCVYKIRPCISIYI